MQDTIRDSAAEAGWEQKRQLAMLEESQSYILLTILAILLSYCVLGIQKKRLLCALQEEENACAQLPDTFPISLCSGILILMSLQFFFRLSRENAAAAAGERNGRPEQAGEAASFLVLLAAVIRFAVLICSRTALESGEAAELFEEAAME